MLFFSGVEINISTVILFTTQAAFACGLRFDCAVVLLLNPQTVLHFYLQPTGPVGGKDNKTKQNIIHHNLTDYQCQILNVMIQ